MTKTELININKRGYAYDNNLATLLENNPEILTPNQAYDLYQFIKNDYEDSDTALCLSFEVLRINRKLDNQAQ